MLERCRVLKDSSPQKKHGFTIGGYSTVQFRAVIIYMVHRGMGWGFPPLTMNVALATIKGKWKNNRTKRNP